MIPVTAPKGFVMAYRLDPYSLDLLPPKTPKSASIHDVVEPTVLFYHKKSPNVGKAGSPACAPATPKTPHNFSKPVQSPHLSKSPSSPQPAIRYVSVSTRLSGVSHTLIAPFRVAPGDQVVFQSLSGGESYGTVSNISDANAPVDPSITRRLLRKARTADKAHQDAQISRSTQAVIAARSLLSSALYDLHVYAAEWQFDSSALVFAVTSDRDDAASELGPASSDLAKYFQTDVRLVLSSTPQSSPALSCCSSIAGDTATLEGSF